MTSTIRYPQQDNDDESMPTSASRGAHRSSSRSSSQLTHLSTAWMPLEGLAGDWARFGAEACTLDGWRATSTAFAALVAETDALHHYFATQGRRRSRLRVDPPDLSFALESTLKLLLTARSHWSEVVQSLELLMLDPRQAGEVTEGMVAALLVQALEQCSRVSLLLVEVGRDQLQAARRRAAAAAAEHPSCVSASAAPLVVDEEEEEPGISSREEERP